MKTVIKSLVVGLMVFALSFALALASMAQAGGINYEGFSSYKSDRSYGYDDGAARGVMFNFSFGGPKDYKEGASIQDIYKHSLTTNQKVGIGLGVVGVFVLLLLMDDDDECIPYTNGEAIFDISLGLEEGYCRPSGPSREN